MSARDRIAAFRRTGRLPIITGHRGVRRSLPGVADSAGRGAPPENTLPAFEQAAREGADVIELDVRLCASGEAVVFHDPTLERMTGGADARAVADVPWPELQRIDLGGGARIPRLADVLALARDRGLGVNVEVKYDVPSKAAVVAGAAREIRRAGFAGRLLVSSFDPVILAGLALRLPGVPRAIILHRTGWEGPGASLAGALGCQAVHTIWSVTSRSLVERLRARGLAVNVWTVNDPAEARRLVDYGVDGLITDTPAAIRAALR